MFSISKFLAKYIISVSVRREVFRTQNGDHAIVGRETEITFDTDAFMSAVLLERLKAKEPTDADIKANGYLQASQGNHKTKQIANKKYLNTDEASKKYNLSRDKIRRLCRTNVLECIKNDNKTQWLVSEESLKAYKKKVK